MGYGFCKGFEERKNKSRVYHRENLTWSNGYKSLCEWSEHKIVNIVGAKGKLRILEQIP